jgi:hypothetical protein
LARIEKAGGGLGLGEAKEKRDMRRFWVVEGIEADESIASRHGPSRRLAGGSKQRAFWPTRMSRRTKLLLTDDAKRARSGKSVGQSRAPNCIYPDHGSSGGFSFVAWTGLHRVGYAIAMH